MLLAKGHQQQNVGGLKFRQHGFDGSEQAVIGPVHVFQTNNARRKRRTHRHNLLNGMSNGGLLGLKIHQLKQAFLCCVQLHPH